jgi:4-hydroxy-3-methylbut-2-enyl diphosphate reductase
MKVIEAEATGFCHGVERAVRLAEKAGATARGKQQDIVVYGHLVHNPQQVAALEAQGLRHVAAWQPETPGTLVVRTHGIAPGELADIREAGWQVVDATCPLVTRTHHRAEALRKAGYPLVVIGKADHPEVKALTAGDYGQVPVCQTSEDVDRLFPRLQARLGVVIQSTFPPDPARAIIGLLAMKTMDLRVFNTVCDVTQKRIDAAMDLAGQVEAMVVVGGHHSANTRQIADACRTVVPTLQVETAAELDAGWLSGFRTVGLASGLSTPDAGIAEVRDALLALT